MSIAAETVVAPPRPLTPSSPTPPARGWLVNPAFDLFFLANAAWPVITLLVMSGNGIVYHTLTFWQIYLITTPHRWITLALVFLDRDRFVQRRGAYLGIAFLAVLVVASVYLSTGTVALLLAIDYLWNAWHFAAQHSGISRIYSRAARPELKSNGMVEKVLLRTFVLYAIFRVPLTPLVIQEGGEVWLSWLIKLVKICQDLDLFMLVLPAALLLGELRSFRRSALPRLVYLTSVCSLYSGVVLATHFNGDGYFNGFLTGLFLSIAIFHATEYLGIVSWSVEKRHARSKSGLFASLLPRWGLYMLTYMVILGLSDWVMNTHFFRVWLILAIIVSYLHYAYDGMIWKVRRPASASVA